MAGSTRFDHPRRRRRLVRYRRGQRPLGASTITQQLVRHFLLTNEVSIPRKIKEALLAYRIEALSQQGAHPRDLSQRDLSRRRRLRGRGGGRNLFLEKARPADPGRGGDARGAAQGAQRLQSVPQPGPGQIPPRLGARRDGADGLAFARRRARATAEPLRLNPAAPSPISAMRGISPRRCGAS